MVLVGVHLMQPQILKVSAESDFFFLFNTKEFVCGGSFFNLFCPTTFSIGVLYTGSIFSPGKKENIL